MNLRKIMALDKKAAKEAQKAVDIIYKKYNSEMNKLIANEIPKGIILHMGNGCAYISDSTGKEIESGKAWGINKGDEQLSRICGLQYSETLRGDWCLDLTVKGKKNPKN